MGVLVKGVWGKGEWEEGMGSDNGKSMMNMGIDASS